MKVYKIEASSKYYQEHFKNEMIKEDFFFENPKDVSICSGFYILVNPIIMVYYRIV
jgi:hypothetical protein